LGASLIGHNLNREIWMPRKINPDATYGRKLLEMFRKLMLDGRRHFQTDLATEFECSPQTISRMVGEIEAVVGTSLEIGTHERRRYYQIKTIARSRLGLDFEELRYLSICRDLASPSLPQQVAQRVEETIFNLSVLLADQAFAERSLAQKTQFAFFSKGRLDYSPHFEHIEKLVEAAEKRLICLVRYKAAGKTEDKEHRFAPGRLVSLNSALYALGAGVTEDFKGLRHLTNLAVHRITDVALTDRHFDFELPEASPEAFGLPWHEPRQFRIQFQAGKAADYVRERIWAEEQKLEELNDGRLLLELTTRSEPEVLAWVRSFGNEAKLVESAILAPAGNLQAQP
jgi:hypothetical protein